MIDLRKIQDELKDSEEARTELMDDPATFFEKRGILLSDEMKASIVGQLDAAKERAADVPGASVGPEPRDGVFIVIRKDF